MTLRTCVVVGFALTLAALAAIPAGAPAREIPKQLPDPCDKAPASEKPVKVYILMGQSNMVGMGDITGGSSRWGDEFIDPVVSVYPGKYDPDADYDKMAPTKTMKLPRFGGVTPTPYPGGGTQVVRGHIRMKATGVYEFRPGYGASTRNIMEVDGKQVHRKEPGKERAYATIKLTGGKKYPFKITYLTDAANGLGWVLRTDIPGTLNTVVRQQGKFPHLVDDEGRWTVRNDVTYKGVISATGQGPLTVGLQGNTIGPELQFGHILGYYHDEPVLIIKASIGNRSLGWDYLPPGSERFEHPEKDPRTGELKTYIYAGYKDSPSRWEKGAEPKPIEWYAGKQYDDCVDATREVLNKFGELFPQYKDQGYEVAGFAWWQGHKDGNPAHAGRYEQNLVRLIKALRKEFDAPKAPFVIATIGFGGWKMEGDHVTVANAQLAVSGEKGKYPEFAGNVLTVETRDFWRDVEVSPKAQGYHYNRNAETYMLVGDAMGRGMVKLLTGSKD